MSENTMTLNVNDDGLAEAESAQPLKESLLKQLESNTNEIEIDAVEAKSLSTPVLAVLMQCVQSLLDNDGELKIKVKEGAEVERTLNALGLDAGLVVTN